jgi:hypothetical protein
MLLALVRKGKVLGENVPTPNVIGGCLMIKVVNSCNNKKHENRIYKSFSTIN